MKKWVITFLAVLCILAGWLTSRRNVFPLAELRFEESVTPKIRGEVFQMLSEYFGKSIYSISLDEIKTKVETHPFVSEVHVRRRLPSTLYLSLVPKQVVGLARIRNQFWMIDESGKEIAPLKTPVVAPFLRVEGQEFFEHANAELKAQLGALSLSLKNYQKALVPWKEIQEISFQTERGFVVKSSSANIEIELGFEAPEFAWDRAMKAYANLVSKKLLIKHLDASYQKRVVARLQNLQNTLESKELVQRKKPHDDGDGGPQPHEIR